MSASQILAMIVVAVASYLFGSLNSAIVTCSIAKHDDIRKYGSKNAGLTNVLRVYGKGLALVTLLCDLFKGVVAVVASRIIVGSVLGIEYFSDRFFIGYVAGLFVVLGHVFPLFYGFKGGKGVLTSCATMLVLDPLSMSLALLVFIIVVALTKYVSLGSILGAVVNAVMTFVFGAVFGTEGFLINGIIATLVSAIVIIKHKANIIRLVNGNENKLSFNTKGGGNNG